VLSRRVDIGVLGVFGDISEVDAGLLRLRGAAMPRKHVPNRTGHPGRVGDLASLLYDLRRSRRCGVVFAAEARATENRRDNKPYR
jgi:hypothetical protein